MTIYFPPRIVREMEVTIERERMQLDTLGGSSRFVPGPDRVSGLIVVDNYFIRECPSQLIRDLDVLGRSACFISGGYRSGHFQFRRLDGHIEEISQCIESGTTQFKVRGISNSESFGAAFPYGFIVEPLSAFQCPYRKPNVLILQPRRKLVIRKVSEPNEVQGAIYNHSRDRFVLVDTNNARLIGHADNEAKAQCFTLLPDNFSCPGSFFCIQYDRPSWLEDLTPDWALGTGLFYKTEVLSEDSEPGKVNSRLPKFRRQMILKD